VVAGTPPGMHPVNGALRFALELAMLGGIGWWVRSLFDGSVLGWVVGSVAVVTAASMWGVFNVPGDPSRSGRAPVPVPGWARLVLEVSLFVAGVAAVAAGAPRVGWLLAGGAVLHYAWYWRRLRWLLTGATTAR
jgi:hypothetical protein